MTEASRGQGSFDEVVEESATVKAKAQADAERNSAGWREERDFFREIEADVLRAFPGLDEDARWELSRRVWAWSKRGLDVSAGQREAWAGELGS